MHSSRMRTARSLPYIVVSVRGRGGSLSRGLCPAGVSVKWGNSVQGVSVHGESLSRGSLSRGEVPVQRDLCPGGLCQRDPLDIDNPWTDRHL